MSINIRVLLAWFFISLFYCYQYTLRSLPNILHDALSEDFMIQANEFGTLGLMYLISYSLLQIPIGILVDKIGVRKVVLSSIICCTVGTFMFSVAPTFFYVQIARFIIGIGSASAFMCALKVVADNMPAGKRGVLIGATLTMGTIGAMFSGNIVMSLLAINTWRDINYAFAVIGSLLYIVLFFILPGHQLDAKSVKWGEKHNHKRIITSIIKLMKEPYVWVYSVLAVGLYTPFAALSDLWGIAFLKAQYEFATLAETSIIFHLFLGLAFGSLFLCWIFEKYNLIDFGIATSTFILTILMFILLYIKLPLYILGAFLIFFGFICGSEMLCFTAAVANTKSENSGEVIGIVNTLNMLGGAILQQVLGNMLDLFWSGKTVNGARYYSANDFGKALSIIMVLMIVCSGISLVIMVTKKRRKYEYK